MTRTILVWSLLVLAGCSNAYAQVGCQPRVQVMNSWVNPSDGPWDETVTYGPGYFGPGYLFDYPAGASRVKLVSFSGHVMRFDASGRPKPNGLFVATPAGIAAYDPEAVQFYGYYYGGQSGTWKVARDFGSNADVALGISLTPFDQWWSAASNAYPAAVWVRWILHVVVC